jgi:hypothetical protein
MSTYKWKKLGLVFSPQLHRSDWWMTEFAQAPCAILRDETVRVFFSCRPKPNEKGLYTSYTAWVDLDRSDLTKVLGVAERPILELGDRGAFDEFGIYPFSVVEFNGRHLGLYGGWTRCESVPFNVAIGCAVSTDRCNSFTKLGRGPILSYSLSEPFILSSPKIRVFAGKLFLYYIAGRKWKLVAGRPEPVYKIRLATSEDGLTWQKADRDMLPSIMEEDEAQASPDVTFSGGRYHMFFCYRRSENYRNASNGYRIGYAWSMDAFTWNRDDEQAGLNPSSTGWDSEMVCYPHIFQLDGSTYMFYIGNDVGREGFGLAILEGGL